MYKIGYNIIKIAGNTLINLSTVLGNFALL